jgi:hypothetical protein
VAIVSRCGQGKPSRYLKTEKQLTRKFEGTLVAAGVLTGMVAVLSMATAWGPHDPCSMQFPKIIGCALGSYESLSGGLIAAGGALFAGWLAWSAIKEQIKLEKQKMIGAKVEQLQQRAETISAALSATRTAYSKGNDLQGLLRDGRNGPSPNATKLAELWRRHAFPVSIDGWLSPAIGAILWDAAVRARDVARDIEQASNVHTSDQRGSYLRTREADAQEASESFSSVLAQLSPAVRQLEEHLADENRQVTAAQAELHQLARGADR